MRPDSGAAVGGIAGLAPGSRSQGQASAGSSSWKAACKTRTAFSP